MSLKFCKKTILGEFVEYFIKSCKATHQDVAASTEVVKVRSHRALALAETLTLQWEIWS